MCIKVVCSHCRRWTWKGCGLHINYALRGIPSKDRCEGWRTGECPDSTDASHMWSFALDDTSLIPVSSSSIPPLSTNEAAGSLEQRNDEERDEDLQDFFASLSFISNDIATESDDVDVRPTIRYMRDFASVDSMNSDGNSERTTSTQAITNKKRELGCAENDSESHRSRLSGSITRIRKALKVVNDRMVNIVGTGYTRRKSDSGKSTMLISEEEERLKVVNRVINLLNGADSDEICQFLTEHCVNEVTLSSTALPPILGLRDVIILLVLTCEVYPDGVWEQLAVDIMKSSHETSSRLFKIKYYFSGTRIYAEPMKTLYEDIYEALREDYDLDETIQAVTARTANMVIKSGTFGMEQRVQEGHLSEINRNDNEIDTICNVKDSEVSSNQGIHTTLTGKSSAVIENVKGQLGLGFQRALINNGGEKTPKSHDVQIPCILLDCRGVIWLEFNGTDNKIVSIEVDVDVDSDICDRDPWTFVPNKVKS